MIKSGQSATSRGGSGARVLRWLTLALVGVGAGLMIGELAVGTRATDVSDASLSFSHLSANPDALVPQGSGAAPCPDCADSYGVAMRLRSRGESRMSDEFRNLGAVDVDAIQPEDPDDDYRFGGRFPDPEPHLQPAIIAAGDAIVVPSSNDDHPTDEISTLPAE